MYMFRFQVLPVRGYPPPMVWSHHGRQGPHTVLCWQQLHEQTVFYNPVCRTLHSTGGEGKMMMCVCVLILPVCFTRPHGMFLVLYRVTNHMAGGPPSLSETGTYIRIYVRGTASMSVSTLNSGGWRGKLINRLWIAADKAPRR